MSANANFSYAIHILTYLATTPEPSSSAEIACSLNTNPVTVRKLMGVLREADLVQTLAGSAGGAMLKRPASQITLGDVYRLVKDDHLFGLHASEPSISCPIGRNIQRVLVANFTQVEGIVAQALMKVSLQDIVDEVFSTES